MEIPWLLTHQPRNPGKIMSEVRYRYQTIEFGEIDIHFRSLRDKQQYPDDRVDDVEGISSANWSLFGVAWDAGRVLGQYMSEYDIEGLRILEVGCGVGLASLLLNHLDADITATDFHPRAQDYLDVNTELNGDDQIPFERSDWANLVTGLGQFDMIIGSDILYERGHSALLSAFIERHANPSCVVIIVDPGRPQRGKFRREMLALGYDCDETPCPETTPTTEFSGQVMKFERTKGLA